MLQFVQRNLLEVLFFSLFFGSVSTVFCGYLLAQLVFG